MNCLQKSVTAICCWNPGQMLPQAAHWNYFHSSFPMAMTKSHICELLCKLCWQSVWQLQCCSGGGGGASPPQDFGGGVSPPQKSCYWTWSGKNIWRGALVGRQKRKEGKRGLEGTKVKGMRGVEAAGQQRFFCLPIQNWTSAPPKKIYDYTTGQLQAVSVPLAN